MDWWGIAWLFVLLAVNAFFVGAEFAVISARRSQIEPRAAAGSRAAKTALWAMEHVSLMLAACQLGITVCSLLILNVSEPAIHHLLQVPLELTGLPAEAVSTIAFVVALLLVSFLHVVFGEMVPKNLSFSVPDRAVLILATPLVLVASVFRPVIVALNATSNAVLRLFRVEPKSEANSVFTLEEVATIVAQSTREGVLSDVGGTLSAAFEFTEKKVRDIASADLGTHHARRGRDPGRCRAGRRAARVQPLHPRRRGRRALRLPAPQGRHRPRRGRVRRARPAEADPPAHLDLPRHRSRGRARDDASLRGCTSRAPSTRAGRRAACSSSRTSSRSSSERCRTRRGVPSPQGSEGRRRDRRPRRSGGS